MASSRHSSATGTPPSTRRRAWAICSTVNLLVRILDPPGWEDRESIRYTWVAVVQEVGGRPVPAVAPVKAESTLIDSSPVLLQECGHFVLARGWIPTVGTNSAHGTYIINDPGHMNVFRLAD